jgi:hypothetical protein
MRILFAAAGIIVAVVLVVLFVVVGYTSAPFDTSGEAATGQVQNGLGHRYTLDAATLNGTWTFNRDADIVLRFEDGTLDLDGRSLDVGCYSGTVSKGAVLTIADGRHVSFASPDSDTTCRPLP